MDEKSKALSRFKTLANQIIKNNSSKPNYNIQNSSKPNDNIGMITRTISSEDQEETQRVVSETNEVLNIIEGKFQAKEISNIKHKSLIDILRNKKQILNGVADLVIQYNATKKYIDTLGEGSSIIEAKNEENNYKSNSKKYKQELLDNPVFINNISSKINKIIRDDEEITKKGRKQPLSNKNVLVNYILDKIYEDYFLTPKEKKLKNVLDMFQNPPPPGLKADIVRYSHGKGKFVSTRNVLIPIKRLIGNNIIKYQPIFDLDAAKIPNITARTRNVNFKKVGEDKYLYELNNENKLIMNKKLMEAANTENPDKKPLLYIINTGKNPAVDHAIMIIIHDKKVYSVGFGYEEVFKAFTDDTIPVKSRTKVVAHNLVMKYGLNEENLENKNKYIEFLKQVDNDLFNLLPGALYTSDFLVPETNQECNLIWVGRLTGDICKSIENELIQAKNIIIGNNKTQYILSNERTYLTGQGASGPRDVKLLNCIQWVNEKLLSEFNRHKIRFKALNCGGLGSPGNCRSINPEMLNDLIENDFKSDKLDDVQKYLLSNDAYSLSNKIFTTLNHHIPGGMFGTITAGSIVGLLISYQGYQGIMSILSSGGSSRKKKRNTHKKKRNTHKKKRNTHKKKEIRIKKRNTKKNKKRNRITLRKK